MTGEVTDGDRAAEHRWHAIEANNSTWELLERAATTGRLNDDDIDDLLGRAYAAAYHWRRANDRTIANDARAAWLLSRVHAVLGNGELALQHAERSAAHVAAGELVGFDVAYAHEARARALACLGRLDEAATERAVAAAVPIVDDQDRSMFDSDLASEPWFGLAR